jgi:hypothetical protein
LDAGTAEVRVCFGFALNAGLSIAKQQKLNGKLLLLSKSFVYGRLRSFGIVLGLDTEMAVALVSLKRAAAAIFAIRLQLLRVVEQKSMS